MNPTRAWLPQGTVYGTLLNHQREFDLWQPRMSEPPYKAAPRAPVLYVKTANTFASDGAAVAVPGVVEVGATLGLVIGDFEQKTALGHMSKAQAAINHEVDGLDRVAGCVLLNDLSLPHASYYRPAIRYRNHDGFLVCGPAMTPVQALEPTALRIEVRINGALVQTVELATLMRNVATLLADVSEFMSLQGGDVLMLGTDCLPDGTRPRASAGDHVEISAPGLAPLAHTLVQEVSAAGPSQGAKAPSGGSADTSVRSVGAHSS